MKRFLIYSIIASVVLMIIVLQNTITTPIEIFFWKFHAPLILLLAIVAILGVITGYVSTLSSTHKLKKELKTAKTRISELETALKTRSASQV